MIVTSALRPTPNLNKIPHKNQYLYVFKSLSENKEETRVILRKTSKKK